MSCCCAGGSSEESEAKEDDGEDNRKRYSFRQRKTVERYQAPLQSRLQAQLLLKTDYLHGSESVTGIFKNESTYTHSTSIQISYLQFC